MLRRYEAVIRTREAIRVIKFKIAKQITEYNFWYLFRLSCIFITTIYFKQHNRVVWVRNYHKAIINHWCEFFCHSVFHFRKYALILWHTVGFVIKLKIIFNFVQFVCFLFYISFILLVFFSLKKHPKNCLQLLTFSSSISQSSFFLHTFLTSLWFGWKVSLNAILLIFL